MYTNRGLMVPVEEQVPGEQLQVTQIASGSQIYAGEPIVIPTAVYPETTGVRAASGPEAVAALTSLKESLYTKYLAEEAIIKVSPTGTVDQPSTYQQPVLVQERDGSVRLVSTPPGPYSSYWNTHTIIG